MVMDKDKVNIDGKTFALKSHDDLTVALEKQYPQGLTVILENESLANLDRYVWRKVEDWEVLKGLVEDGNENRHTIREFAENIQSFGAKKAYALDGGQTTVIAMNGELINNVDFGFQRQISDIIYFATAKPAQE